MAITSKALNLHSHDLGAAYAVSLPAFEGPLDLLLHLIERQELDISEISLVAVTDAYLQTIEEMEELEPGAIADFLVVASRLLFIKSRLLLPRLQTNDDDEEEDPGDALIRQLLEYRKFKEIAGTLKERDEAGLRVYVRMSNGPELDRILDISDIDLSKLHRAVRRALKRIPSDPPMPSVKGYAITVADQIQNVRDYIRSVQGSMRQGAADEEMAMIPFSELLGQSSTRAEVVVTFLAILELIKQQEIIFEQEEVFGEIMIVPVAVAVPTPVKDGAVE